MGVRHKEVDSDRRGLAFFTLYGRGKGRYMARKEMSEVDEDIEAAD